jgi:hypothetical protein
MIRICEGTLALVRVQPCLLLFLFCLPQNKKYEARLLKAQKEVTKTLGAIHQDRNIQAADTANIHKINQNCQTTFVSAPQLDVRFRPSLLYM